MHKQLAIIRKYRTQLVELVDLLSLDQLNKIPDGYNNNIIWHMGHLVVTLPGMSYRPAGLPLPVEEALWQAYKPGNVPVGAVDAGTIGTIAALLLTSLDVFEADLEGGRFTTYTPWVTRTGVAIDSLEDALAMITFHEGLHAGYIAGMKKLV
jgi:hypothetical protein